MANVAVNTTYKRGNKTDRNHGWRILENTGTSTAGIDPGIYLRSPRRQPLIQQ